MKTVAPFVCFILWASPAFAAKDDAAVTLTFDKISRLKPAEDMTREAFAERWGQFEVRIPKAQFPIAAPNCRKEIILRTTGVDPVAAEKEKKLEARWTLYQSLLKVIKDKSGSVDVAIASGPYMQKDKAGAAVLQYCNAYIRTI